MHKIVAIAFFIMLSSCCRHGEKNTSEIPPVEESNKPTAEERSIFEEWPKINKRINCLFDFYCSKHDDVILVYEPLCYSLECTPKGFIIATTKGKEEVIAYRLKRIYQKSFCEDSDELVGLVLEHEKIKFNINNALLEKSINELVKKSIPTNVPSVISHELLYCIKFKIGDKADSLMTNESTLFNREIFDTLNTSRLILSVDTFLYELYYHNNNEYLSY